MSGSVSSAISACWVCKTCFQKSGVQPSESQAAAQELVVAEDGVSHVLESPALLDEVWGRAAEGGHGGFVGEYNRRPVGQQVVELPRFEQCRCQTSATLEEHSLDTLRETVRAEGREGLLVGRRRQAQNAHALGAQDALALRRGVFAGDDGRALAAP